MCFSQPNVQTRTNVRGRIVATGPARARRAQVSGRELPGCRRVNTDFRPRSRHRAALSGGRRPTMPSTCRTRRHMLATSVTTEPARTAACSALRSPRMRAETDDRPVRLSSASLGLFAKRNFNQSTATANQVRDEGASSVSARGQRNVVFVRPPATRECGHHQLKRIGIDCRAQRQDRGFRHPTRPGPSTPAYSTPTAAVLHPRARIRSAKVAQRAAERTSQAVQNAGP